MESFILKAIVDEINETQLPAKVDRVFSSGTTGIALRFHGKSSRYLLISADPTLPYLFVSNRPPSSETKSHSRFRELLDSVLRGADILKVEMENWDRVATIPMTRIEFAGTQKKTYLIAEIIPHRARILLCDANFTILDVLASPKLAERTLEEERNYSRPEMQGKLDPETADEGVLHQKLEGQDLRSPKTFMGLFEGFGSLLAKEVIHRSEGNPSLVPGVIRELFRELRESKAPTIFREPAGKKAAALSPIALLHLDPMVKETFVSMNRAAEAYFTEILDEREIRELRKRLFSIIDGKLKKLEKALAAVSVEREEALGAETWKLYGELLKYQGRVQKDGRASISCVNYYDPVQKEIEIPLDPSLSIQANAARYFKRYAKARRKFVAAAARKEKLNAERISWEETRIAAEKSEGRVELSELLEEIAEGGKPARGESRKAKKPRAKTYCAPRTFKSGEFTIYVGKSAKGNERLSFGLAKPEDFWLHAAGSPGSHVVVKNPRGLEELPGEVLERAAALAAYYSKMGGAEKAEVHYTKRKLIRKVKGGEPGRVILTKYRTIIARPRLAEPSGTINHDET